MTLSDHATIRIRLRTAAVVDFATEAHTTPDVDAMKRALSAARFAILDAVEAINQAEQRARAEADQEHAA